MITRLCCISTVLRNITNILSAISNGRLQLIPFGPSRVCRVARWSTCWGVSPMAHFVGLLHSIGASSFPAMGAEEDGIVVVRLGVLLLPRHLGARYPEAGGEGGAAHPGEARQAERGWDRHPRRPVPAARRSPPSSTSVAVAEEGEDGVRASHRARRRCSSTPTPATTTAPGSPSCYRSS